MFFQKILFGQKTTQAQNQQSDNDHPNQNKYLSEEQAKLMISQMKYNCLENLIFYNDQDDSLDKRKTQQILKIDSDKIKLNNDGIIQLTPKGTDYLDMEGSYIDESLYQDNDQDEFYEQIYEQMRMDMEQEMEKQIYRQKEQDYDKQNAVIFQDIFKQNLHKNIQNLPDDIDDEWIDDDGYDDEDQDWYDL